MQLLIGQLLTGFAYGLIYALMAFGLSIIKGLLNIPNFAHGALYALGAYLCFSSLSFGLPLAGGLLIAFCGSALAGFLIDLIVLKRLKSADYLSCLVVLFGMALIIEQLLLIGWGTNGLSASPPTWLRGAFSFASLQIPRYVVFASLFSALTIGAVSLLLNMTKFGAMIRAGMDKPEMTRAVGINVDLLLSAGMALGSGLAGLAGALTLPLIGATSTVGDEMMALAFVVLVIGGLGSLYGVIAAGLVVGLTQSLVSVIAPQASTASIYAVMIIVLLVRPQGLFGER